MATAKRFCDCVTVNRRVGLQSSHTRRTLVCHTLECLRQQRGDTSVAKFYGKPAIKAVPKRSRSLWETR